MIRGLFWELQLCGDFSLVIFSKKLMCGRLLWVWKLAPPCVFVSKDSISLIYRCEKVKNNSLDVDTLFDVLFFN